MGTWRESESATRGQQGRVMLCSFSMHHHGSEPGSECVKLPLGYTGDGADSGVVKSAYGVNCCDSSILKLSTKAPLSETSRIVHRQIGP